MFHFAKLLIRRNACNYTATQCFCGSPRASRLSFTDLFRCDEIRRSFCDSIVQHSPVEVVAHLPDDEISPVSRKKSISNEKNSHSPENIKSYVQNCADINSIPKKVLRRLSYPPEGLFIVNGITANTVVEHVISENVGDVPLFEVNPGTGVLTKAFLENGIDEIHVFQSSFWAAIRELEQAYPCRIHIHEVDFFSLWKRMLIDNAERQDDIQRILDVTQPKLWHDAPIMKVVAAVPRKVFVNHLMAAIIFQKGYFLRGRPEFYLLMKPYDYHCFTCKPSEGFIMYRSSSVLFQILFETSFLCKLPVKDFIPWMTVMTSKRKIPLPPYVENDADSIYLVKVTPRPELLHTIRGIDNLQPLWHFVRQCFTSRHNKVIPLLENWIPGCGPRLILKGMTIYTKFGELSPSDVLDLFQQFSQWPEYRDCSFLASLDTSLLKSYVESNQESSESEFDSVNDLADEHLT